MVHSNRLTGTVVYGQSKTLVSGQWSLVTDVSDVC